MIVIDTKHVSNALRRRRERECFSVVNRGKAWYDLLTIEQEAELKEWYHAWLNVTDTNVIPVKPSWLTEKLNQEEQLL